MRGTHSPPAESADPEATGPAGIVAAPPKFNADFWEVTISQAGWRQFSTGDHLYYREEDDEEQQARQAKVASLWKEVRPLMESVLTARQCEVVVLHYFGGMNQREIAESLGVSQQSVSEHLFGKIRGGRSIGGALAKLRKACAARGIRWE